jgi:hypothetical protein
MCHRWLGPLLLLAITCRYLLTTEDVNMSMLGSTSKQAGFYCLVEYLAGNGVMFHLSSLQILDRVHLPALFHS